LIVKIVFEPCLVSSLVQVGKQLICAFKLVVLVGVKAELPPGFDDEVDVSTNIDIVHEDTHLSLLERGFNIYVVALRFKVIALLRFILGDVSKFDMGFEVLTHDLGSEVSLLELVVTELDFELLQVLLRELFAVFQEDINWLLILELLHLIFQRRQSDAASWLLENVTVVVTFHGLNWIFHAECFHSLWC